MNPSDEVSDLYDEVHGMYDHASPKDVVRCPLCNPLTRMRAMPSAESAEAALLGACLVDANTCRILDHELSPEDFYRPRNGHIAGAVITLHRAGAVVDNLTVGALLAERGLLEAIGGHATLITYMAEWPSLRGVPTYAAMIAEKAARRRVLALAAEMAETAHDPTHPVERLINDSVQSLKALDLPSRPEGPDRLQTLLDLPDDHDWVIPNLLERGDRLMVTGAEGSGKSLFLAQMAMQFAAGIHPFRRTTFPPVSTLLIDVENPASLVSRRFADLLTNLPSGRSHQAALGAESPGFDMERLRVRVRAEGIDLLSRNDRRWFTERIVANEPDVVFTGPIYKMHRGDATDEAPAREIAAYFDDLRTTYGFALILEAHSPYGNDGGKHRVLRPFGASLWSRWPEFGFGMRLSETQPLDGRITMDWVAWRGARDAGREWPRKLVRSGPHRWPWSNPALTDEPF